ncbi:protein SENSITIVE TO PROTON RHIZOTOXICITY 1-like [Gastrolobium bilobum]|uniref:protein SENSITIVE TO PROTON RHIZOTOXICITY 1-like n=1 Tax=Gastrolobium bilobum TaxID=150636 RepID=UPI002AAF0B0B|nr:protein SENSITIVE TO PROTON RHIZOTOXICITY 1-like [Gastrolobium bilobum]
MQSTLDTEDLRVPLQNLSQLSTRMDSLQRFISQSINTNTLLTNHHMAIVSDEIVSAVRHLIINSAALVSCTTTPYPFSETVPSKKPTLDSKEAELVDDDREHCEIVEFDAVELLENDFHFCEVCGKGFKRDMNLRMHMRAHGDEFKIKTHEALSKKKRFGETRLRGTWFSCPFEGCNRNKVHKKFRPLKSMFCLRNHFKRSHCPKTHTCDRCRKKSFAMLSDLKSHAKQCRGESTWKCTCGTTFSRKDKLFGHVALFEGHLPALEEKGKQVAVDHEVLMNESDCFDGLPEGFFDDLDDFGFGSIHNNWDKDLPHL